MKSESPGTHELNEAAAPILLELTRQASALPSRIAVMVLFIRDHLFDRDLSVARIKEQCQLRDNSVAIYFHAELGEPPAAFITSRRLAVAERLLAGTWLPIWKITQLLGYSSIQVFSRAYLRRQGRRPSDYRRQAPGDPSASADLPEATGSPAPAQQPDLLGRALAGQLEDAEAAVLVRRLLEIYPPGRGNALT